MDLQHAWWNDPRLSRRNLRTRRGRRCSLTRWQMVQASRTTSLRRLYGMVSGPSLTVPLRRGHNCSSHDSKPNYQGKLFAQCRWFAEQVGGEVVYTFTLSGLHDEPVQAPAPPPQPDSRSYHRRSRSRSRTPKRPSAVRRKFNIVLQQGGEGGEDEFVLLSKQTSADIVKAYERASEPMRHGARGRPHSNCPASVQSYSWT